MTSDERPDYRFIVINAQTSETFVVTTWRGLSDFWRIRLCHEATPVAETVIRLRDNPALSWLIDLVRSHSAPS